MQDTASEEETRILMNTLIQSPDNKDWESLLLPVFETQTDRPGYNPVEWEPAIQHILSSKAAPAKIRRIPVFARVAAAAAVLFAISTGIYLLYTGKAGNSNLAHTQDIAPVSNKAMLTLADGRTIPLDSAAAGMLATQGAASIQKGAGNALTYISGKPVNGPLQYNTLSTPRGGQFQLVLPDGTRVWLNAASSIRYPVSFSDSERSVQLSGEAYFEVAANKQAPFKVHSAQQDIQVLGTSFNVNAYEEEAFTKTTLVEGKVKIVGNKQLSIGSKNTAANSPLLTNNYILTPGQQLNVQDNNISLNQQADVQQALAWKNGQLDMNNLDVKALMRQIARWYDVDITYDSPLPQKRYGGILDHKVYLSNIIDVLESQGIRCRLEGKQLHVSAK